MDVVTGSKLEGNLPGVIDNPLILQPGILGNMAYFDGVTSGVSYGNQRHRYAIPEHPPHTT